MSKRLNLWELMPLVFMLVASGNVQATGIDFRLSGDTAELTYLTESSTFGYGGADIGFGAFIDENDNFFVSGSVLVSGSTQGDVRALHFGVGAKVYGGVLDTPNDDSGAGLGIGGQMRYVFPGGTPLAILLEGWAVPEVVSIANIDGIREYRLAVELEVTPSARGYVGYRNLEVDLDSGGEQELDDNVHVGVKFTF